MHLLMIVNVMIIIIILIVLIIMIMIIMGTDASEVLKNYWLGW